MPKFVEILFYLLLFLSVTSLLFLIGIGANPLVPRSEADRGDLADTATPKLAAAQAAIDTLRGRFGNAAIGRGRSLG